MKRTTRAITLLALALSLGLTSCGTQEALSTELNWNLATEPPTLDPALATDTVSVQCDEALFLGLTDFEDTPDAAVIPEIATEWSVTADGLTWTFKMRDDIWWVHYDPATKQAIAALPGVIALSEVLEDNVLLLYDEKQHIATVKGVDESFTAVSGLDSMVFDGEMKLRDRNRPYVVVGQGVAYSLGINLSFIDPLFIYTIDRTARINMSQPEESIRRGGVDLEGVVGIHDDGVDDRVRP